MGGDRRILDRIPPTISRRYLLPVFPYNGLFDPRCGSVYIVRNDLMKRANVIGHIVWAVLLSCLYLLGPAGCGGDSGPTPGSLSITTTALPEGEVNQAYSASLSGSGGAPPYTWSVLPALPAHLSLDTTTGAITGTPTTAARSEERRVGKEGG